MRLPWAESGSTIPHWGASGLPALTCEYPLFTGQAKAPPLRIVVSCRYGGLG